MSIHPIDIFLRGHNFTHSDAVEPSEPFSLADTVKAKLSDGQCRACPQGLNSIAWHFWHMACSEDEGFSLTAGLPRVFDEEAWHDRLGFARRDASGMTKEESEQLSQTIDLDAVWQYRDAVGRKTREVIGQTGADFWVEALTQKDLDLAVKNKVYTRDGADGMAGFLVGLTREHLLSWWGLQHSLIHLGQATAIRHLVPGSK